MSCWCKPTRFLADDRGSLRSCTQICLLCQIAVRDFERDNLNGPNANQVLRKLKWNCTDPMCDLGRSCEVSRILKASSQSSHQIPPDLDATPTILYSAAQPQATFSRILIRLPRILKEILQVSQCCEPCHGQNGREK